MPAPTRRRTRQPLALLLAVAASLAPVACKHTVLGPTVECDGLVGDLFIELTPAPLGVFVDYELFVGDSLQVVGTVRRIDEAAALFDVQRGWYCTDSASSPVPGTVTFATGDAALVRLGAGGWIRGIGRGTAKITASSASHALAAEVWVLVY
jgi:hypothetical protein